MSEYKQCPYCGEMISVYAKKCQYCGEWIVEQQEDYIRCPYCHIPVPRYAEKCSNCGEWLSDEHIEYSVGIGIDNPVVKFINVLWIILGIIIFLIWTTEASVELFFMFLMVIIFGYIGTLVYMLPSIFAASRKHPQFVPILFINLLFGETVIGWIGAMIWACTHRIGRHTHW